MSRSEVASTSRTSTHEQRSRIAHEADAKQEQVTEAVMSRGFAIDWNAIFFDGADSFDAGRIEGMLREQLGSLESHQTIRAIAINGAAIAAWTQRKNEALAGFKSEIRAIAFAEPALYTPSKAIDYWRRFLGLDEQQTVRLARKGTAKGAEQIADRVASELMTRLTKLHDETVSDGLPLAEFIKQARAIAPDASRNLLETEYRTHLSTVYSDQLREQIMARANAFPFMQFMIVNDGNATWYACLPMGTSGPGGRGYICATGDPVTIKWRLPAHWRCRSSWSPVSYREAQRMGILAQDGRTKIALVGNNPDRPYGDPPTLAENPNGSGEVRKVEPQKGFGG